MLIQKGGAYDPLVVEACTGRDPQRRAARHRCRYRPRRVVFYPPLRSQSVAIADDPESLPHSHGLPQALAATPPSTDPFFAEPLLSPEQQEDILSRHRDELRAIPGVMGIGITGGNTVVVDVFVHTDQTGRKPAVLPDALLKIPPFLDAVPVKLEPVYILPPPAGVVVVAPDGTTSIQSACPPDYEVAPMFDWTFCMPPRYAGIPPSGMLLPPIAGIPRVEAANAVARNQEKLMKISGVQSLQLTDDGLVIYTTDPTQLPSDVEGVPVIPQVVQESE